MTEALWLADFVTRFELPPVVKKHILKRIKALEHSPSFITIPSVQPRAAQNLPPHIANQSPSTIANFLKHQTPQAQVVTDLAPAVALAEPVQQSVNVVASAAAAQAMDARHKALAASMSGKPEPGRTSPRKF